MRIKEVMYQRLFNLENYQNEKIGFVAEVAEGEDENKVMAELFFKVLQIETAFAKFRALRDSLDFIRAQIKEVKNDLKWDFKRLYELEVERAELDEKDEKNKCRLFDIEEEIRLRYEKIEKRKKALKELVEKYNTTLNQLNIVKQAILEGNFDEVGELEKLNAEEIIKEAEAIAKLRVDTDTDVDWEIRA